MITFASHQARAGHVGASEDFEQMLGLLVRTTSGEANMIFANPGDWGIDVLVGDLHGRVTVWQAKFFVRGVGRGQQGQITASFDSALRAAVGHGYSLERWVLCIPVSMDGPAMQWWQGWKAARQQDTGVIIDLWDETGLRELLLRPEAADVRRHYYNPYRRDGQAGASMTATAVNRPGNHDHPARRRLPPSRRAVLLGGLAIASAAAPAALVLSRTGRSSAAPAAAPVTVHPFRVISGHSGTVCGVAFRSDGGALASGGDGSIRLWDTAGWAVTSTLTTSIPSPAIAYSPHGGILAIADGNEPVVWLWDTATGSPTPLRGQAGRVFSVAFSPDGKTLASGSPMDTLGAWDVASKTRTASFSAGVSVDSVAFYRDGQSLAIGCHDGTVQLWDLITQVKITVFPGRHAGPVESVAFSPGWAMLASGGSDHTIRLWDATAGSAITVLHGHKDSVLSVAFNPDGKTLASASADRTIRLWDLTTHKTTAYLPGHTGWVQSVAFNPDGKTVASGSADTTIRLWKVP